MCHLHPPNQGHFGAKAFNLATVGYTMTRPKVKQFLLTTTTMEGGSNHRVSDMCEQSGS